MGTKNKLKYRACHQNNKYHIRIFLLNLQDTYRLIRVIIYRPYYLYFEIHITINLQFHRNRWVAYSKFYIKEFVKLKDGGIHLYIFGIIIKRNTIMRCKIIL